MQQTTLAVFAALLAAACTPPGPKPDGGQTARWVDPNACMADDSCAPPAEVTLRLTPVANVATEPGANPEIVRLLPGTDNKAVFVSAVARQFSTVRFNDSAMVVESTFTIPGTSASLLTSIEPDPTGAFASFTRIEENCALGNVVLADLATGEVLNTILVGYNPDSSSISKDGRWLVVSNEDDREDHPCKPADRRGGSVSIIDLSKGPAQAAVVQTIVIDHALDSEPENLKIAPDGDTVIISIQETNEVGLFRLSQVPNATLTVAAINAAEPTVTYRPDGLAIFPDSSRVLVANESGDSFSIVALPSLQVQKTYLIRGSGDVPDSYNRDLTKTFDVHEPEEVALVRLGGALFAVMSLQESGAVIAYNMTDPLAPAFDSIARAGVNWKAQEFGRGKNLIRPEGLAASAASGMVLSANEGEGTVTLYRTSHAQLAR